MCSSIPTNRLTLGDRHKLRLRGWTTRQSILQYGDTPLTECSLDEALWPPLCLTSRLVNQGGDILVIDHWPPLMEHELRRQIDIHIHHAGEWLDADDLPNWLAVRDEPFPPTQHAFQAYLRERLS